MRCHEVDYKIIGHDIQAVEVELDPGETIIAEAGGMLYMDQAIRFKAKMGDGSEPKQGMFSKMMGAGKRWFTGETIFLTHFTNTHAIDKQRVALAAPYPGSIVPINLAEHNEEVLCQSDAFLAAALGTKVGIAFTKRLGAGFLGGEGFVLQKLTGDGMAFIHAGGCITKKSLKNEKIYIDTGCLVAFSASLDYSIKMEKSLKNMFMGSEGWFFTTIEGTGDVWIQSMPFSRLVGRIIATMPPPPNKG